MAIAATILIVSGAGRSAFEDIFRYGRALATDTLPEANAPSGLRPLDHRQRRPRGPAPLAVWNDRLPGLVGDRQLAALAGLGAGLGLLVIEFPGRRPSDVWSRSGRSRHGPR